MSGSDNEKVEDRESAGGGSIASAKASRMGSFLKQYFIPITFEFFGTFMITFAVANYYQQASWPVCSTNIPLVPTTNDTTYKFDSSSTPVDINKLHLQEYVGCKYYDYLGLYVTIFIAIIVCQQLSGSHFNPMVTACLMIAPVMDGNRFDWVLGMAYILFQMLGALSAALMQKAFAVNGLTTAGYTYPLYLYIAPENYGKSLFLETSAAFILVFMWISSQNRTTKFSNDLAINTAFLAGASLASMLIGGLEIINLQLTPVNPTVGFAIFFVRQTKSQWKCMWLYTVMPWLGAFLALGFYYCIYLKAKRQMNAEASEEEEEEEDVSQQDPML